MFWEILRGSRGKISVMLKFFHVKIALPCELLTDSAGRSSQPTSMSKSASTPVFSRILIYMWVNSDFYTEHNIKPKSTVYTLYLQ